MEALLYACATGASPGASQRERTENMLSSQVAVAVASPPAGHFAGVAWCVPPLLPLPVHAAVI